MSETTDLLGQPTTASENVLRDVYRALVALLEDPDLPPTARANVAEAVATLWQAVNNLALVGERPPAV